jgi:CRP/FNR family transcriptional regulator, anaerobic regulatory protein
MINKLTETFQNLGLSNEQIEKMSNIFKHTLELKKGDYFYQNTQICQKIGFLEEGMLRYYYDTEKLEVTRWVAMEGDFVTSLSSFIKQQPVEENIQALQNTKILYATCEDWIAIYQEENFVRELWTRVIEENYIGMENRLFNIIALSAEERYEWILKNYPKFNLYIPDKYLASMLGITPRHLSRIRSIKK